MQENKHNKAGLLVALAVIGIIIGGAIAYPIGHNKGKDSASKQTSSVMSTATTTKAASLRVTLNNLLREHVTTNLTTTYDILNNAPAAATQASLDAENANGAAIANAVGSIYGDAAKQAVAKPFLDHLTQSNNYAKAVLAGDSAAEATSLAALQADLHQIADAFHSVIPGLPAATLYSALNQHESLMNQVAAAYQAGDYTKAYQIEDQALTQISGGADALAQGIVASKPAAFK